MAACRPECGALKRPYQFCVRVDSGQVYASQSAVRHSRRLSTLLNAGALNHLAIRITSPFFGRVPISSFTSHRTGGIVHRTGAARILRQSIRPPGVLRYSESAGKQQQADNCKDSLKHAFSLKIVFRAILSRSYQASNNLSACPNGNMSRLSSIGRIAGGHDRTATGDEYSPVDAVSLVPAWPGSRRGRSLSWPFPEDCYIMRSPVRSATTRSAPGSIIRRTCACERFCCRLYLRSELASPEQSAHPP